MAWAYSFIAVIGCGLLRVFAITSKGPDGKPLTTFPNVLLTYGIIATAYFAAASAAGLVIFGFRPLRRTWIGWALTGAFVMPICYIPFLGFLQFLPSVTGWLLALRGVPHTEGDGFWSFLLIVTVVIFMPMGAAFGVYWRDNPP